MATASDCPYSAIIEVSSSTGEPGNRKFKGTVHNFASKNLTIITGEEIPVSADIRVQSKDLLFLGKVLSCIADPEAGWTIKVSVRCSLLVV